MIIPVRCFSCGALVGDKYEEFIKRKDKEKSKEILDSLGVKRYCCRRMILSHVDLIDEVVEFDEKSLKSPKGAVG
ncbi:MAG: DNA-directed RNA polymerase subunit N [Candidatus Hydrothermarchaeales archaeon]